MDGALCFVFSVWRVGSVLGCGLCVCPAVCQPCCALPCPDGGRGSTKLCANRLSLGSDWLCLAEQSRLSTGRLGWAAWFDFIDPDVGLFTARGASRNAVLDGTCRPFRGWSCCISLGVLARPRSRAKDDGYNLAFNTAKCPSRSKMASGKP